jgi:hypothetical protein
MEWGDITGCIVDSQVKYFGVGATIRKSKKGVTGRVSESRTQTTE